MNDKKIISKKWEKMAERFSKKVFLTALKEDCEDFFASWGSVVIAITSSVMKNLLKEHTNLNEKKRKEIYDKTLINFFKMLTECSENFIRKK
jgi:hypothetical protein